MLLAIVHLNVYEQRCASADPDFCQMSTRLSYVGWRGNDA
jgi:hypothetical protein